MRVLHSRVSDWLYRLKGILLNRAVEVVLLELYVTYLPDILCLASPPVAAIL